MRRMTVVTMFVALLASGCKSSGSSGDGSVDAASTGDAAAAADAPASPATCENVDDPPNDGPFPDSGTSVGISADGLFEYFHILGTGNFICDRVGAHVDGGPFDWLPVRGPDYGTIEDDGLMTLVASIDGDYASDGGMYLAHEGVPERRSFRREDTLPCQERGVTFTDNVLTFGEPAISGDDTFIVINYRLADDAPAETERRGTMGIYFFDRDRGGMLSILDNREGSAPAEPAGYELDGHSYTCQQAYEVPVASCAGRQDECRWVGFEGLGGANDELEFVFRGSYTRGDHEEHTGIFVARKDDDETGKIRFAVAALVDTGAEVRVPGQPDGTSFETVNKPWINDQGVVVFTGTFAETTSGATQGIYALIDGELVVVADNGAGGAVAFDDFHLDLEADDTSGLRGRVDDADGLSTSASIDLVVNDAGPEGRGHVFFTAGFWDGPTRRKAVFRASPTGAAGAVTYQVAEIVRSGESSIPGTPLGFVLGTFHSFALNDRDQLLFKAMAANRPLGILLFYDGAAETPAVHHVEIGRDHLPAGCSQEFWFIVGNFGINDHAQMMFRMACLNVLERKPIWAVWRADYRGPPS